MRTCSKRKSVRRGEGREMGEERAGTNELDQAQPDVPLLQPGTRRGPSWESISTRSLEW